jgi:hypothetical protein
MPPTIKTTGPAQVEPQIRQGVALVLAAILGLRLSQVEKKDRHQKETARESYRPAVPLCNLPWLATESCRAWRLSPPGVER